MRNRFLFISLQGSTNQTIVKMLISKATIGTRVVRSKGDYVVGRCGSILEINADTNRATVDWDAAAKSQVNFNSLELENEPYKIIEGHDVKDARGKWLKFVNSKYVKL